MFIYIMHWYIFFSPPAKTFTISNLWIESLSLQCSLQNLKILHFVVLLLAPKRKLLVWLRKKCFQCLSKLLKLLSKVVLRNAIQRATDGTYNYIPADKIFPNLRDETETEKYNLEKGCLKSEKTTIQKGFKIAGGGEVENKLRR